MKWWKPLKGKVKLKEPLKKHVTFGVGGAADFFIRPKDRQDLKLLLSLLKRGKMPFLLIGSGSNILAGDKGVRAAVVSLDAPDFKKITLAGNILEAGCGVSLGRVIQAAQRSGLSGLEFLSGIPGTIGGALAMNAGVAQGPGSRRAEIRDIARVVKDVTVMDPGGNVRTLRQKEIRFGYRKSSLSQYLILSSRLKLNKGNKRGIQSRIKGYLDYRRATQDPCWRSAGCVFKNPAHHSAGRLISLCGLKGKRIGGARVSSVHANFIVNDSGRASAADILELMALVRKKVKARFKIELEPEVKIWES